MCKQFPFLPVILKENIEVEEGSSFEFIDLMNRGKLKFTSETVVTFVLFCHRLFDLLSPQQKCCRNYIIQCYKL